MFQKRNQSRKSPVLFIGLLLAGVMLSAYSGKGDNGDNLRFNHQYKLKKDHDAVIITTVDKKGEVITYDFSDFSADVLYAVYRDQEPRKIISKLAKKYELTETESRRKIKQVLNTLEVWDIVIRS